jgi:hypothetical protein
MKRDDKNKPQPIIEQRRHGRWVLREYVTHQPVRVESKVAPKSNAVDSN